MAQAFVSRTVFLIGIAGIIIAIVASSIVPPLLFNGVFRNQQAIQGIQGETGPAGPQGEPGIGFARQGNISVSHKSFVSMDKGNIPFYMLQYLVNMKNSTLPLAAPIQLPDGVNITKVTFYYYDIGPDAFYFAVDGYHTDYAEIIGETGWSNEVPNTAHETVGQVSITNLAHNTVDNNNCVYELRFNMPGPSRSYLYQDYRFYKAVVQYEFPG